MNPDKLYIQYGCGLSAPTEWVNFDSSPTLRVQKSPIIGGLLAERFQGFRFPDNVRYGDIVKGLPIKENSCEGVYCSHVLEHLSREDFEKAIENSLKVLRPNGKFRLVMPDLSVYVSHYLRMKEQNDHNASMVFIHNTLMGESTRSKTFFDLLKTAFGNSKHLWLWDFESTEYHLKKAGFKTIRTCKFNDSQDEMFKQVESLDRFQNALAIEAIK